MINFGGLKIHVLQMKTSSFIKFSFVLILAVSVISCACKQEITAEETQVKVEPKLLFLNYQIQKLDNETSVRLINQITTDGKLKGKTNSEDGTQLGDLECIVLDRDLIEIEKQSLKNPLKKVVEFINDSGHLEKRILDLDSAQFSIRLQLKPQAHYIVIHEITTSEPIKHLKIKID